MHFSCKITSAVLDFLEQHGEDLAPLLDGFESPEELLRDSSYWISAKDAEDFLQKALLLYQPKYRESLLISAGHTGHERRSWGVLDSVLRMMPQPQEIFAQPEKLISYFVSPAPPIENVVRSQNGVEFDLPVSADLYPLATTYLRASFEALPLYVGQSLGACSWDGIHLKLSWHQDQQSIFAEDPGHQISPELMRSIVDSLEKHQRELEAKNKELQEKNDLLLRNLKQNAALVLQQSADTKTDAQAVLSGQRETEKLDFIEDSSIASLEQNVARLGDYMVRAQQLITMLVAQDRLNPSVKEAMRRTDWEKIKDLFPQTIGECQSILRHTKEVYRGTHKVDHRA